MKSSDKFTEDTVMALLLVAVAGWALALILAIMLVGVLGGWFSGW